MVSYVRRIGRGRLGCARVVANGSWQEHAHGTARIDAPSALVANAGALVRPERQTSCH